MKELRGKVALGLLCLVLGFIISVQFKTVKNTTGGGLLSNQRAQQLSMELKNLRSERERLNEELTTLEKRLKEYELSEADENLIIKNLKNDLEKYQIISGHKAIEGAGVVITVDDPPGDLGLGLEGSFIMYNYDILLELINKLNAAGAEGISINDQRYTATTEIYYMSNSLLINSIPTTPPLTIKAIGNPETLEAALNMRFGIVWDMRQYHNLQVTVKKDNAITIPRYNKITQFQFAKPIEPAQ